MFPEKKQDSGGGIGPASEGQQVSSMLKMVERKRHVCNVLTPWFPEAQPHGPAGTCSRRKGNIGEAHGLIIFRIFSKSNIKTNIIYFKELNYQRELCHFIIQEIQS